MGERLFDYDGTFFRGMKSDADPAQLPLGYYWAGLNVVDIGGMLSTRPGYKCLVTLPKGKLQGGTIFRPRLGLEQFVVCIDGAIYVAPWPFVSFKQLPNILMSGSAKQVYWCQTVQSAQRKTADDLGSAIEVINPKNVLFIQDNGLTAPAWYDGSSSGHVRDHQFETPIGGPMAWVGDRLWIAFRNFVRASDISNPFSFREDIYLGGVSPFSFSGEVTALAKTPNLAAPQLVVFTDNNAELIKAYIRNRNLWPAVDGMQTEIFDVGCASQRSVVSHYGRLSWFCASGTITFDAAEASKITSRLPIRDNEMLVSKTKLSSDLSLVAGAAFGQFLLMSVPAEDSYNKHTWVLNDASIETLTDDSGPSWASYWIGTRPVEWAYGTVAGEERIFHVSVDEDGENRLWEAFRPERLDNGCPITWAVFTRGYFGQTSQTARKLPGQDCQFSWAEIALTGIEEDLDLGVFYAGGSRGAFKPILTKRISVDRGSLMPESEITATTDLFAFKAQSRKQKTENVQTKEDDESGSCPVELPKNEDYDESFQLLVVGQGPATIRYIRAVALEQPEDFDGAHTACENETEFNAIRFDGSGLHADDRPSLVDELGAKAIRRYTSNKTASLEQAGVIAIGVGSAESIISQDAADRVAAQIALKQAESELVQVLPSTYSAGEGL